MDTVSLKRHLPTFTRLLEERRQARQNRLPKHLRQPVVWPIYFQMALNVAISITLCTLMLNKDEYMTEAGPAIVMGLCMVALFYTTPTAFRLKARYAEIRGRRAAKFNFFLTACAFLLWPLTIVVFLP